MFIRHQLGTNNEAFYHRTDAWSAGIYRNRVRRNYRLLRKRGVSPEISRQVVFDVLSAGLEVQWHYLFNKWMAVTP